MKAHFLKLLEYEKWANDQLIELTQQVTHLPPKVKAIFAHLLNAQLIWHARLTGQPNEVKVWEVSEPHQWQQLSDQHIRLFQTYVEGMSADDFLGTIEYTNSKGVMYQSSIYEVLTHLGIHSSYHRGQIVVLLRPLVDAVPATDFIFFVR
ncbi:MAG: DinB family protein [Flammeovirgaceae bacterium]